MARMTKKMQGARKIALIAKLPAETENAKQYEILEGAGYTWHRGEWKQRDKAERLATKSGSQFTDVDGNASGLIRLRVMGHPDDVHNAIHRIKAANWRVIEVSEPYHNRRGDGYRVYITCLMS